MQTKQRYSKMDRLRCVSIYGLATSQAKQDKTVELNAKDILLGRIRMDMDKIRGGSYSTPVSSRSKRCFVCHGQMVRQRGLLKSGMEMADNIHTDYLACLLWKMNNQIRENGREDGSTM